MMDEVELTDEEIEKIFSSEEVPRQDLRLRRSEARYLLDLIRMDIRRGGIYPPDKWTTLIRVHLGSELSRIIKELSG